MMLEPTPRGELDQTPLKRILLDIVRGSGPISFRQYMALCLYDPEHGYYVRGPERTGMRGDYFTSSDLHPIFARLLARQAVEMWEVLGRPAPFTWIEMGAGRGLFAQDFLKWVANTEFGATLNYVAIEPSAKARLRLTNRASREAGMTPFRVFANLGELGPITGCFFSNELLDAFPVSIVTRARGRLQEIYVTTEGETLRETLGPLSDTAVAAYVARYAHGLEEGHRIEVNLMVADWARSVAERLVRGFVLTIDYGDLARRLYTADRPRGTLMAYRGHVASEDFFSTPGEQDLTAHVNFSGVISAGEETGLNLTGFTTQERFLMALGEPNQFADLYDQGQSEVARLDARLKLKRLITPGGMGTVFKVLIQHKEITTPKLIGLKFSDEQRVTIGNPSHAEAPNRVELTRGEPAGVNWDRERSGKTE
jgi:SAM-dependent MidA family methyltransferase